MRSRESTRFCCLLLICSRYPLPSKTQPLLDVFFSHCRIFGALRKKIRHNNNAQRNRNSGQSRMCHLLSCFLFPSLKGLTLPTTKTFLDLRFHKWISTGNSIPKAVKSARGYVSKTSKTYRSIRLFLTIKNSLSVFSAGSLAFTRQ